MVCVHPQHKTTLPLMESPKHSYSNIATKKKTILTHILKSCKLITSPCACENGLPIQLKQKHDEHTKATLPLLSFACILIHTATPAYSLEVHNNHEICTHTMSCCKIRTYQKKPNRQCAYCDFMCVLSVIAEVIYPVTHDALDKTILAACTKNPTNAKYGHEIIRRLCKLGCVKLVQRLGILQHAHNPKCMQYYIFRSFCRDGHESIAKQYFIQHKFEDGDLYTKLANALNPKSSWSLFDMGHTGRHYDLNDAEQARVEYLRKCIHMQEKTLCVSCVNGHIGIVKWFVETKGTNPAVLLHEECLCQCCARGHYECLLYILEKNEYAAAATTKRHPRPLALCREDVYDPAFVECCKHGRVQCAKLLTEHVKSKHPCGATIANAFIEACANGHLSIAEWIVETFKITPWIATSGINRHIDAYHKMCMNGNATGVKWFLDTFGTKNTHCTWLQSLDLCCVRGHLNVVCCILDDKSIHKDVHHLASALIKACLKRHQAIVDRVILCIKEDVSPRELEQCHAYVRENFLQACECAHLDVAQLLTQVFTLHPDEECALEDHWHKWASTLHNAALLCCCASNEKCGHIVTWLMTTFGKGHAIEYKTIELCLSYVFPNERYDIATRLADANVLTRKQWEKKCTEYTLSIDGDCSIRLIQWVGTTFGDKSECTVLLNAMVKIKRTPTCVRLGLDDLFDDYAQNNAKRLCISYELLEREMELVKFE